MELNECWKPSLEDVDEIVDYRENLDAQPAVRLVIEDDEVICYLEDEDQVHFQCVSEEFGVVVFYSYYENALSRDERLRQLASEKTGIDIKSNHNTARDINAFWGAYDEMRRGVCIITDYISPEDDMDEMIYQLGWPVIGSNARKVIFENMALNAEDLRYISSYFGIKVELLITKDSELYDLYYLHDDMSSCQYPSKISASNDK